MRENFNLEMNNFLSILLPILIRIPWKILLKSRCKANSSHDWRFVDFLMKVIMNSHALTKGNYKLKILCNPTLCVKWMWKNELFHMCSISLMLKNSLFFTRALDIEYVEHTSSLQNKILHLKNDLLKSVIRRDFISLW